MYDQVRLDLGLRLDMTAYIRIPTYIHSYRTGSIEQAARSDRKIATHNHSARFSFSQFSLFSFESLWGLSGSRSLGITHANARQRPAEPRLGIAHPPIAALFR